MLFVLNRKTIFCYCTIYIIFVLSILTKAYAFGENLTVHGFVAQGLIQSKDSNFINDDNSFSLKLTEVGINASYQLSDKFRVAGQAVYLNGGNRYPEGPRIDYLLLDWSVYSSNNWQTNIYLGRFKNYHWLYSSTRDVPINRPSIILPQSVYFDGTRDMSVGGDGLAVTSKYSNEKFGDFDINFSSGTTPLNNENVRSLLGELATGSVDYNQDLQCSIYWQPSAFPLRIGLASTRGNFDYNSGENDAFFSGDIKLNRYYVNAEYHGEKWLLSAELLQEILELNDIYFPGFYRKTVGEGGFVQANYQLNRDAKLLIKYERYFANKNDKNGTMLQQSSFGTIPRYFAYQHDFTLGLSFNLAENFEIQLEHHWYDGTARLMPLLTPNPTVNNKAKWQLSALQFIYWF